MASRRLASRTRSCPRSATIMVLSIHQKAVRVPQYTQYEAHETRKAPPRKNSTVMGTGVSGNHHGQRCLPCLFLKNVLTGQVHTLFWYALRLPRTAFLSIADCRSVYNGQARSGELARPGDRRPELLQLRLQLFALVLLGMVELGLRELLGVLGLPPEGEPERPHDHEEPEEQARLQCD